MVRRRVEEESEDRPSQVVVGEKSDSFRLSGSGPRAAAVVDFDFGLSPLTRHER